ncbi:hypothetical protein [Gelria sp. Kuro-4]|uniref:hypothetical protein n=1 Tax=Gelria sp. Kuro-4 TaxID=2796927 RepID=UPI001BEFF302|nr:hypothetical protein [Gelria sp. Kuro-4]BCV23254.1 hypothetical protein kuro4_00270 [Gelria sp. Kuro-4]
MEEFNKLLESLADLCTAKATLDWVTVAVMVGSAVLFFGCALRLLWQLQQLGGM